MCGFQEVRGSDWVSLNILTYIEVPPPFPDKRYSLESYQGFTNITLAYNVWFIPFLLSPACPSPFTFVLMACMVCMGNHDSPTSRWPRGGNDIFCLDRAPSPQFLSFTELLTTLIGLCYYHLLLSPPLDHKPPSGQGRVTLHCVPRSQHWAGTQKAFSKCGLNECLS